MKIYSLVENNSINNKIACEHGLSIGLEYQNHLIIYDVGQTNKFISNARQLNFKIEDVDAVILSHGHFDHTGGLPEFLKINKKAKVYVHERAFKERYSQSSKMIKFNGIQWLNKIEKFKNRIVTITESFELFEDFWLITNNAGDENLTSFDNRLVYKIDNKILKDHFEDEIIVIANCKKRPIVLSGCAHNGIVNILAAIYKQLSIESFEWVIGGLHLSGQTDLKIKHIIDCLSNFHVANWAINHCTGELTKKLFNEAFADTVVEFKGGQIIEV